jgi:hypothetical protein
MLPGCDTIEGAVYAGGTDVKPGAGATAERERVVAKGREVYRRLAKELEAKYPGQIVAIEVESGDHVVGEDELEAARKARERFPGKRLYFARVGSRVVHKFRVLC